MKHTSKTAIFKVLDKLPSNVGFFLYHKIQNYFSKETLAIKVDSTEKSLRTIKHILRQYQLSLENMVIIEMGSGWVPIMPYLLIYEAGAKSVDTYDINKHYSVGEINSLNKIFEEKYKITKDKLKGKFQLAEGVHYYPKTDVKNADFSKADLLLSRFVLEHVPPQIIESLHDKFTEMKKGSHILHMISPSDHRAYSDSSLSMFDFLQYSQSEWDSIQTKYDYHNRLRLPQYLEIFKKHFEVVHVDHNVCKPGTAAYTKFKALAIHEDFKGFSDLELTAGSINVLLRKK